jgi:hypothetical protein
MTRRLIAALLPLTVAITPASASKLFMGAYPNSLIVFDEGKRAVTERITLTTGLPTSLRLSQDRKRIYVTTITTSGIEVIDVATRKVINQFSLNTPTTRYRFNGGAPDPTGKFFYTIVTRFDKGVDRYEVSKPQYAVIDLEKKEIVRTVDVAPEDESVPGRARNYMMVSSDGKLLYQFKEKVVVVNTDDFKVVERIELAKPEGMGLENVGFGGSLESISEPFRHVSLFNAEDPYIHNKVFGVARFDLPTRKFDFTPIGPAPDAMAGLQVSPNGRDAYTVVTNGKLGNKRCEFWHFDMASFTVKAKSEFQCKTRFSFGMSGDGRKLYIYGASFDIESYDARTLRHEGTWDLRNDITGAGLIVAD